VAGEDGGSGGGTGIGAEAVASLSRLARLGLAPEELDQLGRQMGDIIAAVGKLAGADVSQVDPTSQVGGLSNVTRPDEVVAGLSAEEALANAATQEAGLLRVPAIQ